MWLVATPISLALLGSDPGSVSWIIDWMMTHCNYMHDDICTHMEYLDQSSQLHACTVKSILPLLILMVHVVR